MVPTSKFGHSIALALVLSGSLQAEPPHGGGEHGGGGGGGGEHSAGGPYGGAPHPGEPHQGPSGYQRVGEPQGWNTRPNTVDRNAYHHNFQAARSFHVGPYHRPSGWAPHHWAYGQILPRAYFGPQYLLADYWLFALEIPPSGYEWVRDGADALLVDVNSGEILQVEYGVFA